MKIKYQVIVVLTILINLSSCRKVENNFSGEIVTIKIPEVFNYSTETWENISDLEEVVILETNSESIIKNIDKIVCDKKRFYILDRNQKTILIFAKNGKFITKINNEGKGSEEYREIRDFDLDEEGNIYLLDYRRIVIFDKTLKFRKYINLVSNKDDGISFIPLHLTTTVDDEFYLWQGSFGIRDDNFTNKSALFKVSNEGTIIDNYIPFKYKTVGKQRFFRNYKDDVLITPIKGNDTIYCISKSKIYPRYFIDFGSKGFKNSATSTDDYFSFHTDILESSKYLHFKFRNKEQLFSAFYSKKSAELKIEELSFGLKYNLGPLRCVCEETFISAVEGYIVNYTIDDILKSVERKDIYDKLSKLKDFNRENNQVLFIFRLKGF